MEFCTKSFHYKLVYTKRNAYQLDLGFKVIDLTFCQLLSFRKKIIEYSTYEAIETILNEDNFILLFVADNKHLLFLDIPQILELKNLVLSVFEQSTTVE